MSERDRRRDRETHSERKKSETEVLDVERENICKGKQEAHSMNQ